MDLYVPFRLALVLLLLHLGQSQHHHQESSQLSCRQCEGHHDRSKCGHETCHHDHQMCATRAVRFNDGIRYWEFCVDSNSCHNEGLVTSNHHGGRQLCAQCCSHHSYCNEHLCGENQHVNTYSCLSCYGEDTLQDCKHHQSCDENHICIVRAVQAEHSIRFYGGCVHNNDCNHENLTSHNPHRGTHQVCGKCCHGDNCNRDLCEYTRYNGHSGNRKLCWTCTDVDSLSDCTALEECLPDETCSTLIYEDKSGSHHVYAGCESRCHDGSHFTHIRYDGQELCRECCDRDLCNLDLCGNVTNTGITAHSSPATQSPHSTQSGKGVSCSTCYAAGSLENCKEVEECLSDEICGTLVVDGRHGLEVYAGCEKRVNCHDESHSSQVDYVGTELCRRCCDGDLCNLNICGNITLPTTTVPTTTTSTMKVTSPTTVAENVPVVHSVTESVNNCLSCYNVSTLKDCEPEPCHISQMCSISVYESNQQRFLFGGCVPEYACEDGILLIDDQKGVKICGECCKGNNCNRNRCPEYMTTTKEPTTTVKATTTTKPTIVPTTTPSRTTTTTPPTTTTPTSTTIPTSTTTPMITTSTAAPTTTAKPIECELCDGGLCGLIPGNDPKQICPSSKPNCMNTVQNEDSGQKIYTKQCATFHECQTKWWEESSDETKCTEFSPLTPYFFQFTCSFCCVTSGCNSDIFPAAETLFQGKS